MQLRTINTTENPSRSIAAHRSPATRFSVLKPKSGEGFINRCLGWRGWGFHTKAAYRLDFNLAEARKRPSALPLCLRITRFLPIPLVEVAIQPTASPIVRSHITKLEEVDNDGDGWLQLQFNKQSLRSHDLYPLRANVTYSIKYPTR